MASQIITQDQVKDLFEYREGELYRKVRTANCVQIGDKAGSLNGTGYLRTRINNKHYQNHRIIFLYHHGYLPQFVDHADNNPLNNKIENLREATAAQNQHNKLIQKNNTSGVKGVSWHKPSNKWLVHLRVNGKKKHFGCYNDIELAELVAQEVRTKYHGQYARHS
jgi:hypothetical protein